MKKGVLSILVILACVFLLTGCVTRVPNSEAAKAKLEQAGYSVSVGPFNGEAYKEFTDGQVIHLHAEKGDAFLEAYFFRSREDTDLFYEKHGISLRSGVEAYHKFGYVICRGSASAVEDFLR